MNRPAAPAAAARPADMPAGAEPVIEMRGVCTRFGDHAVHTDLDLVVRRGEILAIAGGSGSGKTVLMREMILLQRPSAGSIRLFGVDTGGLNADQARALRRRWGVMFQRGGLFGALSVRENIGLPLREHSRLDDATIDAIADWKLMQTGLPPDAGWKRPDELSGGMLKRASLARAIALDPELLILDEPTSGLDPASAAGVDALIKRTHALYGLTIVMITHDLGLLWRVADRVAVLGEGRVIATGTMAALSRHAHPIVRAYFDDPSTMPRADAAMPVSGSRPPAPPAGPQGAAP